MSATPAPFTLPGRPVRARLTADQLAAYLTARGWVRAMDPGFLKKDGGTLIYLPLDATESDVARAVGRVASMQSRHPLDVLADAGGSVVP